MTCSSCSMRDNHAVSAGGALHLSHSFADACSRFSNVLGSNNTCEFAGGGAYFDSTAVVAGIAQYAACMAMWESTFFPSVVVQQYPPLIAANTASRYGPSLASPPASIVLKPAGVRTAAPGQSVDVVVALLDGFGQVVVTPEVSATVPGINLDTYQLSLAPGTTAQVQGAASWAVGHSGFASLHNLRVAYASLGEVVTMTLVSEPPVQNTTVSVKAASCSRGSEAIAPVVSGTPVAVAQDSTAFSCRSCLNGTYKVVDEGPCRVCPSIGTCCLFV